MMSGLTSNIWTKIPQFIFLRNIEGCCNLMLAYLTMLEDKMRVDQPGQLPIVKDATIQKTKETLWLTTQDAAKSE